MKIVHAIWEKRNLGCDAYEITLDRKDLKDFDHTLQELHNQDFSGAYVTLKMPVGDLKALHTLEDEGFRFMETQFKLERILENYKSNKIALRYKNIFLPKNITKDNKSINYIIDNITPQMFTSDRIYLDQKLDKYASWVRYKNWITDLMSDSSVYFIAFKYNNNIIGFEISRLYKDKKIVYGILSGIFEKYQRNIYGFLQWDCSLSLWNQMKLKKIEVQCSSNNNPVLNMHMLFNYKIISQKYVLRKY